jgi:hypothetical protein
MNKIEWQTKLELELEEFNQEILKRDKTYKKYFKLWFLRKFFLKRLIAKQNIRNGIFRELKDITRANGGNV